MEQDEDGQTGRTIPGTSVPQHNEATGFKGRPYDKWGGNLLTPTECTKVNDILAACQDPTDLQVLTMLATSVGGFVDDEVRQVACMSQARCSLTFSHNVYRALLARVQDTQNYRLRKF